MPSIKEYRLRVKSLQNTSKITSAMKMVSAARLRRAQDAFNRNRPYAQKMQELLEQVTASFQDLDHPLMKVRDVKKVRYIVIASDRGLAGGFNNNLLRFALRAFTQGQPAEAIGLGRRAKDFVVRNRVAALVAETFQSNAPTYANAQAIAEDAIQAFTSGEVDAIYLVYNRYNSVLSQTPVQLQMLPFAKPEAPKAGKTSADKAAAKALADASGHKAYRLDYIVEPGPAEVFAELLPKLVTVQVLRGLLENAVGEHTARMTAMDAATKNTKELIGSLTLKMNRARQAAITKELIEIVSGAEALKG
ncbi:MAG: ATP synthase F1 subunit gamma [Fibrobacteres bacterium]|nr:ATP synthase F1 subunit gamma [Fibrobacterota bacterium]